MALAMPLLASCPRGRVYRDRSSSNCSLLPSYPRGGSPDRISTAWLVSGSQGGFGLKGLASVPGGVEAE